MFYNIYNNILILCCQYEQKIYLEISHIRIAAAIATFNDSVFSFIGINTVSVQVSSISSEMPCPSLPKTSTSDEVILSLPNVKESFLNAAPKTRLPCFLREITAALRLSQTVMLS